MRKREIARVLYRQQPKAHKSRHDKRSGKKRRNAKPAASDQSLKGSGEGEGKKRGRRLERLERKLHVIGRWHINNDSGRD